MSVEIALGRFVLLREASQRQQCGLQKDGQHDGALGTFERVRQVVELIQDQRGGPLGEFGVRDETDSPSTAGESL